MLLISGAQVVRAIHTSTGVGGDSPDLGTPPGKCKIYRKELQSWSVPVQVLAAVRGLLGRRLGAARLRRRPRHPASHGCARLPLPEAKLVYDFVSIGTPVRVI